jgi:hypothetical protein
MRRAWPPRWGATVWPKTNEISHNTVAFINFTEHAFGKIQDCHKVTSPQTLTREVTYV